MKLTSTSAPASRWAMSKVRPLHLEAPRHEQQQRGEQAEHQRDAEELRHAEHAHLGDRGLEHGEQEAAGGELGDIGGDADQQRLEARRPAAAMPQGTNRQAISET